MAINKNHEFEDLDGKKCAIVERSVGEARMQFLRDLLTYNRFETVVTALPVPAPAEGEETKPQLYTLGVTDLTFNPTNAIFGRLLKTRTGNIVTLAYWQQTSPISEDSIPYFNQHSH